MAHNILITGASGYLGGSLFARLPSANLTYGNLYALVRTTEQAEAVKQYGAEPLQFDVSDEQIVQDVVLEKQISIVYHLIDAVSSGTQLNFIKALAKLKGETGKTVHFLHVCASVSET